ncbi:MAG TPA: PEP-CTERM sorting domain-containing protein [Deltaproteobacteria bacterium]|nr:PEP-CTERM sorting domain-containing protein [Deltaproteobacteria bacterium]
MGRFLTTMGLVLSAAALAFLPRVASASHITLPATWDFETPVSGLEWTTTTRTEYLSSPTGAVSDLVSSTLLGPLTGSPLDLFLLDVFVDPTPYAISFDLILIDAVSPAGFSLSSAGQVLVQPGDLLGVQPDAFVFGGGGVFHFDSLVSPASPGCCGDVSIEWSLTGGTAWGIDNVVLTTVPVPEPSALVMSGLGLALLARRSRRRGARTPAPRLPRGG